MDGRFSGVHWMLATPFDESEEVDTDSISRLVEKAQESGCEGVVVLGVTGEAARLTDEEGRMVQSEKMLEIDFVGDKPIRAGDQFGLGRVK